jgi:hypothetical protein
VFAVLAWHDPAPWRLWVLAGYVLGTPLCAAAFLAIPWLLGRRRAVTAAGTAGLAIGLTGVGLVITSVIVSMMTSGFTAPGMWVMPLMVYVAVLLMHLFGAVRWGDIDLLVLPWLMFFAMPGPHYLMGVMFPVFFYMFGARLVDPTFART